MSKGGYRGRGKNCIGYVFSKEEGLDPVHRTKTQFVIYVMSLIKVLDHFSRVGFILLSWSGFMCHPQSLHMHFHKMAVG